MSSDNKEQFIGTIKMMNCGMTATIIEYKSATDITIQFEDGTIVEHRSKYWFNQGKIANPSLGKNYASSQHRKNNASILGQTSIMKNGMKAKVIRDGGKADIDIEFEDGYIAKSHSRSDFLRGLIRNPNAKSIVNDASLMHCGMIATVIEDNGSNNITVEFEDGVIVRGVTRDQYKKGTIQNPMLPENHESSYRRITGMRKLMNCNLEAIVIEDNGANDITVEFENGDIQYHVTRQQFKLGSVSCPSLGKLYSLVKARSIIGTHKTIWGMDTEVIEDNGYDDIVVRFSDGFTSNNILRRDFFNGLVYHPSIGSSYVRRQRETYINRSNLMSCGMWAKVTEYNRSNDITVEFEDGSRVEHKAIYDFLAGKIGNPNFDYRSAVAQKILESHSILGASKQMYNGLIATVVRDSGTNDIDVEFEDGCLREHLSRTHFFTGLVRNPNLPCGSLPELTIYNCIKRSFPDAVRCYRPDWLKNPCTGYNLEIDIWIPSVRVGVEYDGAHFHSKETQTSKEKCKLIEECVEIKKLITVLEKGAMIHQSDKHKNYMLSYTTNWNERRMLFDELVVVAEEIVNYIKETFC